MNIAYLCPAEAGLKRTACGKARNMVLLSMLACALYLLLQLCTAFLYPVLFSAFCAITGLDSLSLETQTLYGMINYIFLLAIPSTMMALILKYGKGMQTESKRGRSPVPKLPFLYLFGTIGASYLVNLIVSLLSGNLFDRFTESTSEYPVSALGIVLTFVYVAVLPALLEELLFRGLILKSLLPYGKWGAILISSMLFGLMHIDPPRIIFATFIGIALGICYEATRSIKFGVLIHFLNNSISVAFTYISLSENEAANAISSLAVFIMIGIGIAAVIYYSLRGVKHKKVSLLGPVSNGYLLPAGRYLGTALLNFGIIPLGIMYAVTLWIFYFAA